VPLYISAFVFCKCFRTRWLFFSSASDSSLGQRPHSEAVAAVVLKIEMETPNRIRPLAGYSESWQTKRGSSPDRVAKIGRPHPPTGFRNATTSGAHCPITRALISHRPLVRDASSCPSPSGTARCPACFRVSRWALLGVPILAERLPSAPPFSAESGRCRRARTRVVERGFPPQGSAPTHTIRGRSKNDGRRSGHQKSAVAGDIA